MRFFACNLAAVSMLIAAVGCRPSGQLAGAPPYASGPYAYNPGGANPPLNQYAQRQPTAPGTSYAAAPPTGSLAQRERQLEDQLKNARTHARLQDEHLRAVSDRLKQATAQLAQAQGGAAGAAQLTDLDRINQEKERQLASARQQVQKLETQLSQLRGQLQAKDEQLAQVRTARDQLVSSRPRGSVSISPNSSSSLPTISLAGIEVRRDGDVVRLQLPADQLFERGTVRLLPVAASKLDQTAAEISRVYPTQRIGIEGHAAASETAGGSWRNAHHVSSARAMAVYEYFTRRSLLRAEQLHVVGHGNNHPVYSNATEAGRSGNQRVEIVIYPERVQ